MRVTSHLSRERRIADILRGQERLEGARDRVSTGKRITRPSDAPSDIADLLRVRANVAELSRRQASADSALPTMKASASALQGMTDMLREVRTLTLQAVNATTNSDQQQVLAGQLDQIRDRILTLANTRTDGRYLFAGTNTDTEPFEPGPPVAYTGNADSQEVTLAAGIPFATSVSGETLLNRRGSTDLFQNLSTLAAAMRAGDTAGMQAGLQELDTDMNHVIRLTGDMGSRIQYVELMRQQLDEHLTAAKGRQSQLEDVDLAEAIIDATTAEHAQQAALAMASRIDQPSLLDFLR
jgi:flagellar hook-associated protein 3 FlgL